MQVRDAGNLLTRASLAIPSVDTDEIIVNYRSMDELVRHLRWVSTPSHGPATFLTLNMSSKVQCWAACSNLESAAFTHVWRHCEPLARNSSLCVSA